MDARFYNADDIDIELLANNMENIYRAQGYQAQHFGDNNQVMVQLKKGSDFEALIGLQAALSVIIQRSGGGVLAMIGQQKWMDKAAVGAVGIIAAPVLWPLMITAGAGAIRQASLGNQVLNVVDGLVRQQRPEIQIGPVPMQIMPQIQRQWAPPPPQYLPPPQYNQPAPVYTPPPEPEPYVPPVPKEPPVQPQTTITYTPSAPKQGTPAAPKQPQKEEVYYTPPANPQPTPPRPPAPPVKPQPVTPKPQAQPKKEEVYYTPPPDLDPTLPAQKPLEAKPSAKPAFDPTATWGYLTFGDGKQVKLAGERALVGRYDHDVGGMQPEVDLSNTQGSDTVSRIHATLEHIGSANTLTDLNSTNSTRLNGKRLEPDKPTPINDGDAIAFGKVTCTFKKA